MKLTLGPAAEACGISKQAFSQAEKAGRLKPCGKNERGFKLYDVEDCKKALKANSDPQKSDAGRAQQKNRPSNDFFEPPDDSKAGVELARNKVKLRNEELKLAIFEGKLVDAEKVTAEQETRASAEREALLNLPGRVSAELAGKFGAAEREMFSALQFVVKRHLQERSSTQVNV